MNNPPAFPGKQKSLMIKSEHLDIASEYEIEHNGMTLRDYFAARGLEALMHKVTSELESKHYSIEKAQKIQDVYASMCYSMADAMLKARDA